MSEMEEIWKPVQGYEGLYEVSNLGNVRSVTHRALRKNGVSFLVKSRILKPAKHRQGYVYVVLCKDGKESVWKIHRLVALAFIPNPHQYPQVNHKNELKNDNRVWNLEWCSAKYNSNYGTRSKRISDKNSGILNKPHNSKPVLMFSKNGMFLKEFPSLKQAEREMGVSNQQISNCCLGKRNHKTAGGFKWSFKK